MFLTGSPWLEALLVLAVAAPGSASVHCAPQARLPLFKVAPVIDGTVDEKEWTGAARMERFGCGRGIGADGGQFLGRI